MKAIIALFIVSIAASAQEMPLQKLRLLPLGDPPPFQQVVRDGVRYEIDAPAGTLPPAKFLIDGIVSSQEAPVNPLRMTLGRVTTDLTVQQAKIKFSLRNEDGSPWTEISPHASGNSLILLWKSGASWKEVGHVALDDSQAVQADYAFHFTNVTAVKMGVILGDEKLLLEPKATFTRIINKTIACRIVYMLPGNQMRTCFQSELSGCEGSHQRLIVYPTNSKTTRNPAKVLVLTETHANLDPLTVDLRR